MLRKLIKQQAKEARLRAQSARCVQRADLSSPTLRRMHADVVEELFSQPDVADALLGRLPLSAFLALGQTCRSLRSLVHQQPERAWLSQKQPPWPLLRAHSVRAQLATQQRVCKAIASGTYTLQTLTTPGGLVRVQAQLPPVRAQTKLMRACAAGLL